MPQVVEAEVGDARPLHELLPFGFAPFIRDRIALALHMAVAGPVGREREHVFRVMALERFQERGDFIGDWRTDQPAGLPWPRDALGGPIDVRPANERLRTSQASQEGKLNPWAVVAAHRFVHGRFLAVVQFSNAPLRLFEPMASPIRFAREWVAPGSLCPRKDLLQDGGRAAVHRGGRDGLNRFAQLVLRSAFERLASPPCNQCGHVGVGDFVKSSVGSELANQPFKVAIRRGAVTMVLPDFLPVPAGCMAQEKRTVAGTLLGFDVRTRLGLQIPFEGFGAFTVCGFGIARKSTAPDLKVVAECLLVGALID